jgi:hypothetical protein
MPTLRKEVVSIAPLSLTSSPVLRGRIEEGESRKGDLWKEEISMNLKPASAFAVACPLLLSSPV